MQDMQDKGREAQPPPAIVAKVVAAVPAEKNLRLLALRLGGSKS
jgi:hypothetical protein